MVSKGSKDWEGEGFERVIHVSENRETLRNTEHLMSYENPLIPDHKNRLHDFFSVFPAVGFASNE